MLPLATLSDIRTVKVAVVDDDASVRSGLSRLARSHGFACTTFESGEKALTAPEIGQADCIILDIRLSGIDGFETRDRLEAQGLRVPIIFITAHPDVGSPEWQRQLKGRPCFAKPFEENDLIDAIQRTLKVVPHS
jgi:FixJ family two-component response regulator